MDYFLFTTIFIYLANWVQISAFLTKFLGPRGEYKLMSDTNITKTIFKKTGIKINRFYLLGSKQLFGGMFTFFGRPILMLSEGLYKDFNNDELEYVLLHETGHHIYKHSFQDIIAQAILVGIGIYIINQANSISVLFPTVLGIAFTITFVEFAKWHERQAENFAVRRMDNPTGMISAAKKLKKNMKTGLFYQIRRRYFVWNVLPSERIAIAYKEIEMRRKT